MSDQLFAFVVFVLLARLLEPSDIGAFAVMLVIAEVFRTLSTAGLVQVVAREKALCEEFTDTVYLSHLALSLLAYGLIVAGAHPFARFMGVPEIAVPLQVLGVTLPISALGLTHMALRLRDFGHRTTALRSVVSGVIAGGAAITAATAGLGLWALVIQRVLSEVVGVILSRAAYRWTPGRKFRWAILRNNAGLSSSLTATQLVFNFTRRLQELVIGGVIGMAAVGVYRTAWRTSELIAYGVIRPFTTVAMQTLARVKDDPAELSRAYRWMLSRGAVIAFPALAGFGALAPLAVPTVFGDKWIEAGPLAQVFAFMALPFTLNFYASPVLGAVGASRSLLAVAIAQLALTALFTLLAAPYGVLAVAWAYVVRAYLTVPLQITLLKRVSGIGPASTWAAVWEPLAASTVMCIVLHFGLPMLSSAVSNAWIQLALATTFGAIVYVLALSVISPDWRSFLLRNIERART